MNQAVPAMWKAAIVWPSCYGRTIVLSSVPLRIQQILLTADMPGVSTESVGAALEDERLAVSGRVACFGPELDTGGLSGYTSHV
jgi:hypothetical protein